MKWFEIALGEVGHRETPGPAANPRIVEYHSTTLLKATSDEVPWCSSFVNWCVEKAGIAGTRSAAAKSWASWGDRCEPKRGCVIVLRQKKPGKDARTGSASGYHVGFMAAINPASVTVLGGNQSDSVKESVFRLAGYDIVATRWPKAAA